MSGCCFNQVESGPRTDLQLVERPVVHMGFIMGLGENQSGTIVFPLLLLKRNTFLSLSLMHTHTRLCTEDDSFQLACTGEEVNPVSSPRAQHRHESVTHQRG